MDFKEHLEKRFSVRNFSDQTVEKEKIEYILECARLAPSAANKQPWLFYVITSIEAVDVVRNSYPREWFNSASVYIIVCQDFAQSWKRMSDGKDHADIDAAIVAEHIMLATETIGLSTCWVCNFDIKMIHSYLNLEESVQPIAIFPIGYADKNKIIVPYKKRKSLEEIVKWL